MTKVEQTRRRRNQQRLREARQSVHDALPDIVSSIVEGARTGNYLQARFLFDFAGIESGSTPPPPPSLAETLLQALAPAVDKNPPAVEDSATAEG